ncbi:MAG: VIT domain-containing protein, partial [Bacteroidota bacterium]
MKRLFLLILSTFLSITYALSQSSSVLKVEEADIRLDSVSVEVSILGNVARTTTTFVFYNPNERVLEGELNFPLQEGQSVYRFAMDVNGRLREGVIIEKEVATRAFESITRQAVDPGILEQTVGNNYRVRVYPIPEKDFKKVIVAYEEEITDRYTLTLDYGTVKDFSLEVTRLDGKNFDESSLTHTFLGGEIKENHFFVQNSEQAKGEITLTDLGNEETSIFRNDSTFYLVVPTKTPEIRTQAPTILDVFWDVSASGDKRNLAKERELLKRYLQTLGAVQVRISTFSYQLHERRSFSLRDSSVIIQIDEFLREQIYDGGTNLQALNDLPKDAERVLLFSDGLSTLGKLEELTKQQKKVRIDAVVSSQSADFQNLRSLTERTGGSIIKTASMNAEEAVAILQNDSYRLISVSYDAKTVREVYPKAPFTISADKPLSLAGKLTDSRPTKLFLSFGTSPQNILKTQEITLESPKEAQKVDLDRQWAKLKSAHLQASRGQNAKAELIALAKAYHLVTPYTSLIVLDRLEDYLRYDIVPPPELQEEYFARKAEQKAQKEEEESSIVEGVLEEDEEYRREWWEKNLKKEVPKEKKQHTSSTESTTANESNPNTDSSPEWNYEGELRTITGTVLSVSDSFPLPGVSVVLKGTTHGTQTDFDGLYSLEIPKEENVTLVFSYFGVSQEIEVLEREVVDVQITDAVSTEEVVVTGYQVINPDSDLPSLVIDDNNRPKVSVAETLSGKVAGLDVT